MPERLYIDDSYSLDVVAQVGFEESRDASAFWSSAERLSGTEHLAIEFRNASYFDKVSFKVAPKPCIIRLSFSVDGEVWRDVTLKSGLSAEFTVDGWSVSDFGDSFMEVSFDTQMTWAKFLRADFERIEVALPNGAKPFPYSIDIRDFSIVLQVMTADDYPFDTEHPHQFEDMFGNAATTELVESSPLNAVDGSYSTLWMSKANASSDAVEYLVVEVPLRESFDTYLASDSSFFEYVGVWNGDGVSTRRTSAYWYQGTGEDSFTFSFDGTGFDLLMSKGHEAGIVDVTIDGGAPVEVDLYNADAVKIETVLSVTNLADGHHSVKVEAVQRHNAAAEYEYSVVFIGAHIYKKVPSVFDTVFIDPVFSGCYMSIYVSDEEGDNKVWTPLNGVYRVQRGFVRVPEAAAKYIKLEFWNLVPQPYTVAIEGQQVSTRRFPRDVDAYFNGVLVSSRYDDYYQRLLSVPPLLDARSVLMQNEYAQLGVPNPNQSNNEIIRQREARLDVGVPDGFPAPKSIDLYKDDIASILDDDRASLFGSAGVLTEVSNPYYGTTPDDDTPVPRKFYTERTHDYEYVNIERTEKVAYFAGIREVAVLLSTNTESIDGRPFFISFNRADTPAGWARSLGRISNPVNQTLLYESEDMLSYRLFSSFSFAANQRVPDQLMVDPSFTEDPAAHWLPFDDANEDVDIVWADGIALHGKSLRVDRDGEGFFGGVQSELMSVPVGGTARIAGSVYVPDTPKGRWVVAVLDNLGNELERNSVSPSGGKWTPFELTFKPEPFAVWWNDDYASRVPIIVSGGSSGRGTDSAVFFEFDTDALITATEMLPDRSDYRIIYFDGLTLTDIDRDVTRGDETWFRVQRDIPAGEEDYGYYAYYNNPDENSTPNSDIEAIFAAVIPDIKGVEAYHATDGMEFASDKVTSLRYYSDAQLTDGAGAFLLRGVVPKPALRIGSTTPDEVGTTTVLEDDFSYADGALIGNADWASITGYGAPMVVSGEIKNTVSEASMGAKVDASLNLQDAFVEGEFDITSSTGFTGTSRAYLFLRRSDSDNYLSFLVKSTGETTLSQAVGGVITYYDCPDVTMVEGSFTIRMEAIEDNLDVFFNGTKLNESPIVLTATTSGSMAFAISSGTANGGSEPDIRASNFVYGETEYVPAAVSNGTHGKYVLCEARTVEGALVTLYIFQDKLWLDHVAPIDENGSRFRSSFACDSDVFADGTEHTLAASWGDRYSGGVSRRRSMTIYIDDTEQTNLAEYYGALDYDSGRTY